MEKEIDFKISGEFIELFKLLKVLSLVSTGGEAKNHIDGGDVIVNGKIDTRKRAKIRPGTIVSFNGHKIRAIL